MRPPACPTLVHTSASMSTLLGRGQAITSALLLVMTSSGWYRGGDRAAGDRLVSGAAVEWQGSSLCVLSRRVAVRLEAQQQLGVLLLLLQLLLLLKYEYNNKDFL